MAQVQVKVRLSADSASHANADRDYSGFVYGVGDLCSQRFCVFSQVDKSVKLDEGLKKVQQENEELKARMDRHAALSR